MLRPCDHVRLQIGVHIVEIVAIARYTDQQIPVVLRALLGGVKRFRIHDVELDMMATQGEVATNQGGQFRDILLPPEQAGQEALVQQRAAALHLIQLTEGLDNGGRPVGIGSVRGRGTVGDGTPGQAAVRGGSHHLAEVDMASGG